MSTSGSDPIDPVEEDDDGKIYQWIHELNQINREETENYPVPQSSEHTPAHCVTLSEQATNTGESLEVVDMDLVENMQACSHLNQNEKKPWRKSGAAVSDYFNYGFDEKSWSEYCKKQSKLQAFIRKQEFKVQKEQLKYIEGSCASSSSGRSSVQASRALEDNIDVSGGQTRSSRRRRGRLSLTNEARRSQRITEMSHKEDVLTWHDFAPPVKLKSLLAFDPLSSSFFRSRHMSLSSGASMDSKHPRRFGGYSTSQRRYSSGEDRTTASYEAVFDSAEAWECYMWKQKRDRDKDRLRQHNHDKKSKKSRNRKKQNTFTTHNSGEEQTKHNDSCYKSYRSERVSGLKRIRDTTEKQQKSPQSSSFRNRRETDEGRRVKHTKKGKDKDVARAAK